MRRLLVVVMLMLLVLGCGSDPKWVRCPTCPEPEKECEIKCPEGEKPDADCKCVKECP